ncbi:MAG: hypothetical protein U0414_32125 [Polyangiaceae bacterium]
MIRRTLVAPILLVFGLAACAGTAPASSGGAPSPTARASGSASEPIASATASAAAGPPFDLSAITVTTVSVPSHLVLDGDPSDWGALTILPAVRRDEAPQKPGPSHVGVALTSKSVYVVGAIAGAAKTGFALALHFEPVGFPEVGLAMRGGGMTPIGDCPEGVPGFNLPVAECKSVRAAYDAFVAQQSARFTRVLRVESTGIHADDPALDKLVSSGTFKSTTTPDGFAFEAELPLSALPRASEAPIGSIGLAARVGVVDVGHPEAFVRGDLAAPVSFEPNALARAAAFMFPNMRIYSRPQISYQPGEPNKIEVQDYPGDGDTTSLEVKEHVLYTKLGGDADTELGIVDLRDPVLMVTHAGKMTGSQAYHLAPKTIASKKLAGAEGWVVASSYVWTTYELTQIGAVQQAAFEVVFVDKSGNVNPLLGQGCDANAWSKVTPTLGPNFDTLTLSGTAYDLSDTTRAPKAKQHVWRWDSKIGGYTETTQ